MQKQVLCNLFKLFLIFIITLFLNSAVKAQQKPFDPYPQNNRDSYQLDFRQFFVNEKEEKEYLKRFYSNLDRFYSYKNKSTLSAKNLFVVLKLQDSILIQFFKHDIYHDLLASVDRKNMADRDACNKIEADFSEKTAFFEKKLTALSNTTLKKYFKEEPLIEKYRFYITDLQRNQSHQAPLNAEESLALLAPSLSGWQFELYETITDNIQFDDIQTSSGKFNVKKDRTTLFMNSDAAIRKEGFKKLYQKYNSMRDLYAFTLIRLADVSNKTALIHNFPDAAEMYYLGKFQSKASINSILQQIIDSVSIYKHYQQIRIDSKKRTFHTDTIHYWDLGFSKNLVLPEFSIDSASKIVLGALKPLGKDYQKELADLLNPVNRRMEIAPGKNKRSGGFSRGFTGTKSIFYTGGYRGSYDDVRILTHESTHAVHRQLMNNNHVIPVYASGPNYLFESFAIFSEFLLTDHLMAQSKTRSEKQYFLEQYFDSKGMALFSISADALLEQKIHEGVSSGTINNADDLDSLNQSVNKIFSVWDTKTYPELNQRWITASLFYEDPFYEINYVLGSVLALEYYKLYNRNRDSFCKNYVALMKNGFNASPQALLKIFLGIDIDRPDLVSDAIDVIKTKVKQLDDLYN
jgi:oligoendopeptidase F